MLAKGIQNEVLLTNKTLNSRWRGGDAAKFLSQMNHIASEREDLI